MIRWPRWLATLPVSLALHAVVAAAAVSFLRTEALPTALVIDLNAVVAGADDGPGGRATAGEGAAPSARADRRAPAATRSAPSPRSAPASPPRVTAAVPSPAPVTSEPAPPAATDSVPPMTPPRAPEPVARTEAPRADSVAPASAPSPAVAPRFPSAAGASPAGGVGTDVTRGSADGSGDASTAAAPSGGGGAGTDGGRGGGTGVTSRVAAAAPGTGSGTGAGIGTDYAAYLGRLRQRIQESLRYPAMARRRGVTGTVQLEIAIAADGAIAAVSVIASSSHDILDRAAVEAARSLARAPFPADVRPRALTVRLPVVFELQ